MTYAEYIQHHARTPKDLISCIEIRHNTRNNWYSVYGKWHGQTITAHAPDFLNLQQMLRDDFQICLPARKDFIFSHAVKGYRIALLQGYLPGSAIVDMSACTPRIKERS